MSERISPVHGKQEPQRPGEGRHPLAVEASGKHPVDHARRNASRPPSPVRWTESSFTGERREPLESTQRAVQPCEPACKQTAVEVAVEFVLDKTRVSCAGLAQPAALIQEGFEVLTHHGVQSGLLRLTASVAASDAASASRS